MKELSCRMIHHFNANETFVLEYFENEELAYEATKQGNIWGYVGFHENFTPSVQVPIQFCSNFCPIIFCLPYSESKYIHFEKK